MRTIDRHEGFKASGPDEISILTWNLLAPCYDRSGLDWASERLPSLRRWLERLAHCDVICFQEVDKTNGVPEELQKRLAAHGFASVVQERKGFPVVNATFFKAARFQMTWAEHRSRVLLCALQQADGTELCVANVHLEAGDEAVNEAQRVSQLKSAISRLRTRAASCEVVCGDFNSALAAGSKLREMLEGADLHPAPTAGPTLIVRSCCCVLDHIWVGGALTARAVLGSPAKDLRALEAPGLPTTELPSDHLPVAALFRAEANSTALPLPPGGVDEALRDEWCAILWSTPCNNTRKTACREQRRLEAAFLDTLNPEVAKSLRLWHVAAADTARRFVKMATFSAVSALHSAKVIDPGGGVSGGARFAGG